MSPRFRYRASTGRGEVVEGMSESGSRDELLDHLRSRHLHALSIDEVPGPVRVGNRMRQEGAVTRWSRSFATLLGAGTPLERALTVSAGQTGHAGLARVLEKVLGDVQAGKPLSEALSKHPRWFPPLVPAMARAGEASGAMGEVFEEVADHIEEVAEVRSQVRSALVYPAVMAVVAAGGISVLLLFVIPRFAGILQDLGTGLPVTTRALVFAGTTLRQWWWLILSGAVASTVASRAWLRRPSNRLRWHRLRLTWPVWGELELKLLSARFTRIVGLLLTHGLPLLPSLRIGRESVGNLHVGTSLDEAITGVAEGHSVARSVDKLLPSLAVELLAVGEETGQLDLMCLRVARTYEKEIRRSVKVAISLLEPVMIVVFGLLVGLVAWAMLQAIYSVNANLT